MFFTITTDEVAVSLCVGRNTITRLRAADILRPGVHFIPCGPGSQKHRLRWNLDAVIDTMTWRGKQIPRPKAEKGRG